MRTLLGLAAFALLADQVALAQDARASPALPSFPQVYETADLKIRVVKVADGLANPWSLAWLPNGDVLITGRAGRLRVLRSGVLDPEPVAGVPEVKITLLGGLLDVVPHPSFASNGLIYLSYSKGGEGNLSTTAISRGRLVGKRLENVQEIFVAENWSNSPTNFGGRMVFGRDGMLYTAIGERQEQDRAQNTLQHASARPVTCPRSTRSVIAARRGSCSTPSRASSGRTSTAHWAATRSTSSRPARTTVGRSSLSARTTTARW